MKHYFLLMIMFACACVCNAQITSADEVIKTFEKEHKGKDVDFDALANTIAAETPLDNKGGFTYVQVVEAPGKTKDQLYIILNTWFMNNIGGKGIMMNDKDLGCILAKTEFHRISKNGLLNSSNTNYEVSVSPTVRTDIKEGKVRITYNVPEYELEDVTSKEFGRQAFKKDKSKVMSFEESYPYNPDGKYKKMMAKALVFAHYLSVMFNKSLEDAIKNDVLGNESDDDW